MPRLPTAADLGGAPTANPRGGISQLHLEVPKVGHEAQALEGLGQAIQGLGNTMMKLALKQKQELDSARTEDATNKYSNGLLELEFDEEKGFTRFRGGAAVQGKLLEQYQKKRQELRDKLRDELDNQSQQIGFDQRAVIADRQFDTRIYQYVASQAKAYHEEVHRGVLETEQRNAALNWQQPGQIELAVMRTRYELLRKARLDGYNLDNAEDKKIVNNQMIAAETGIHAAVLAQMLSSGQDSAAAAYFERVKPRLTPEAIVKISSQVNSASTDGQALRGVDAIWEAYGPKNLDDPVRLDVMESVIREQFGENPSVVRAAVQELRSRATAHNDSQREMEASNKSKVLDAFHNGATLAELMQLPEYWELDGDARTKMRDYITNSGYTEQQRARANNEYLEGEKSKEAFQAYWELSNPAVLTQLSEAQILSLEPDIGQKLVADLMVKKRAMDSPQKVMEANIDADLFNAAAADVGLKPYKPRMNAAEKEKLGRLRNYIEGVIDREQQILQRKLHRDEKEALIKREMDKKVMIDEWGRDPKMPVALVKPEQREKVYVPMRDIDPTWMKEALNYMRSTGIIPLEWTDEEAQRKVKGRLERAYAVRLMGGTSAEGRAALEGEQ